MGTKAQLRRRDASVDEWDIYTRISKVRYTGDLVKTDRQERLCRQMAAKLGLKIGKVWCDPNLSAWKRDKRRPGWDGLLNERIATGAVRGVLTYHGDRLLRHPDDCGDLIRASDDGGGVLVKAYNSEDHDLTDSRHKEQLYYATVKAWGEVTRTSERVTATLKDMLANGVPMGPGAIFGYQRPEEIRDRRGNVVQRRALVCPLPEEAEIIREVATRVLAGASWNALAAELNERRPRVLTARGGRWTAATLRDTIALPRHGGLVRVYDEDGTLTEVDIPRPPELDELAPGEPWPVLDADTFQMLSDHVMSARAGRRPSNLTLLAGIIQCDPCQLPMYGATSHGTKYGTRVRYRCNCGGNTALAVPIDDMVTHAVVAWYAERGADLAAAVSATTAALDQQKERVEKLEANVDNFYAKKAIEGKGLSPKEIEQLPAMQAMKASLRREQDKLTRLQSSEHLTAEVEDRWAQGGIAVKRRMVRSAVRRLAVRPTGRRGGFCSFNYDRVILEMR